MIKISPSVQKKFNRFSRFNLVTTWSNSTEAKLNTAVLLRDTIFIKKLSNIPIFIYFILFQKRNTTVLLNHMFYWI